MTTWYRFTWARDEERIRIERQGFADQAAAEKWGRDEGLRFGVTFVSAEVVAPPSL